MNPGTRVLVIAGPTAAGKSAAAIAVCEAVGGELVSCDSVQVYRGVDVGTAKPTAAERERVRHWCVDIVEPDAAFDAAVWAGHADGAIRDISGRGRVPVVCGGTGLYLRALLRGLVEVPEVSAEVQSAVRAAIEEDGPERAHARLAAVDPEMAARLPAADTQRVGRALAVQEQTGRPLSAWQKDHAFRERRYDATVVGWWPEREELYQRIGARVERMLAAGWVDEVERLLERFDPECTPLKALGYRDVVAVVRGEAAAAGLAERVAISHRRYARRQLTWFKGVTTREEGLTRVDPANSGAMSELMEAARAVAGEAAGGRGFEGQ